MNFGTLKDIFLEKLIESYVTSDKTGKTLYKKFLRLLKEDEALKTAFIVFKEVEEKTFKNESIAMDYLTECKSLFDKFRGDKSLTVGLEKLANILESSNIDYRKKQTKPLHESLEKFIFTNKNVNTLYNLLESQNDLVSWLITDKTKQVVGDETEYFREGIDPKKFLNIATNKFNDKYKDSLTEEEKNILKVLRENNDEKIKTLVSDLVKESVSLVNHYLSNCGDNIVVKSKLLETKDTIYKMSENNESFKENVLRLYGLKKSLKYD